MYFVKGMGLHNFQESMANIQIHDYHIDMAARLWHSE